jgi:hypothetical protein
MAGLHNDINMLQHSPVFVKLVKGHAPPFYYEINGSSYTKWATFVKTVLGPLGQKSYEFAERQENCMKDVERAFGVLQS